MPKKNLALFPQKVEPSNLTHPSFWVILRKVECTKKILSAFPRKLSGQKKGLPAFLRKLTFLGKAGKKICFATHVLGKAGQIFFATRPSLQLPKSYDELKLVSLQFHRQKLGS